MSNQDIDITGSSIGGSVYVAGGDIIIGDVTIIQEKSVRHVPITPPERLFGRGELWTEVRQQIYNNQAVLLHGMGGMGKTALAAVVGTKASRDRERFADGVLWLTVLGKSLAELCDDVFRVEGETDLLKLEPAQKPAQVRNLLGSKRLLVVLDDVDQGSSTAHDWQREAHPPHTPLLITSRDRLRNFMAHEVAELARKDSVRVLAHYADMTIPPDTAGTISQELGDHPLALELMGGLIRDFFADEPAAVLDELGPAHERIRELTALEDGDTKNGNVYLSLQLSWKRLTEEQKLMLDRLAAMFAPSTGDELLSLAVGLGRLDYRKAKGVLQRQSFLRAVDDRSALHALTTAFVRAELEQAKQWGDARTAAVDACVTYANTYNQRDTTHWDKLEAELDNLLGAAHHADQHDMPTQVNRLAFDLWGNSSFMIVRGYQRQAVDLLQAGVRAARALNHKGDEGSQLNNLGEAYRQLGELQRAIDTYEQALPIIQEVEDRRGESMTLMNLGNAYRQLGELQRAIDYYQQSLAIKRDLGDRRTEGKVLGNLGNAYKDLGELERAAAGYQQSIDIAKELGNQITAAGGLFNLGRLLEKQGRIAEAIAHVEEAREIFARVGITPKAETCERALRRLRGKG